MTISNPNSSAVHAFRKGTFDGIIFLPVLAPFSALFGIIAADIGLRFGEVLGYSLLVFAGASQIATMTLIGDGAPLMIALLAGMALNLRMLLYSATMVEHFRGLPLWRRALASYVLVDQNFALSEQKFPQNPDWSKLDKWCYFIGVMSFILVPWHIFTILGYWGGQSFLGAWDISFALPLSFMAMVMPSIRTIPHVIGAVVAMIGAVFLHNWPYSLGLLMSAFVGILIAAEAERRWFNE